MTATTASRADAGALRRVLKPNALADAIRRAGVGPADRIDITRVHFSARRPVVLHLTLVHGGRSHPLLAEFLGEGAVDHAVAETARLAKSRRAQIARQSPSPVVADPLGGLVFRPPGLDARLPGLRLLTDAEAARTLMARAMGDVASPVSVTLVAHRLGKRAVLRLRDRAGRCCFVRLGPTANEAPAIRYRRHERLTESLGDHPDIAVPRPLLFEPELGAAVYSALPGAPMDLQGARGFRALDAAIKALDALQGADRAGLQTHGPNDEEEILSSWRRHAADLCPQHERALDRAHDRVVRDLKSLDAAAPGFCHRDFHEGQILIRGDGTAGILDFDTAAQADPMIDVGNLMAHVFLRGLRTSHIVAPFEHAAETGAGFERPPEDRHRARIWRRAALLRLACIHAVTSEPLAVVDALFAEASA